MGWIGLQSSTAQGSRVVFILLCIGFLVSYSSNTRPPFLLIPGTLSMFIIISGFSDLFKVKPKGKIWRVHLKLKCLPKTANGSAICLEALK